jgi:proteasome lid subunit RPN8/RPN11
MSDLSDPQDSTEETCPDTVFPAGDKRIVFGSRKPTEEVSALTGLPLIIEAPFPYERTLEWLPAVSWEEAGGEPQVVKEVEDAAVASPAESVEPADNNSDHKSSSTPFNLKDSGNTNVVVSQEVLIKVNEHVSQSLDRELGGFLLGNRYRCTVTGCDYVIIDQYSPAKFTESNEVRLAFTHDAWAQISDELSGKFLGKLLIGWYHSHPNLDVFLSSHDMEIQTERFAEPWMVALVLEPAKHHGGFFCSRDGRVNPHSPVEFFELLERNSRDSVLAWENYRALDPSTSSTPNLSTTNTATPTSNTSQELLEVRAKQAERAPVKRKRRGRFFVVAAILLVLVGAGALGVKNRKRILNWWQQRTSATPPTETPQPSPVVQQQSTEPQAPMQQAPVQQPTVATPEASPAISPSPSPTLSPMPSQGPTQSVDHSAPARATASPEQPAKRSTRRTAAEKRSNNGGSRRRS